MPEKDARKGDTRRCKDRGWQVFVDQTANPQLPRRIVTPAVELVGGAFGAGVIAIGLHAVERDTNGIFDKHGNRTIYVGASPQLPSTIQAPAVDSADAGECTRVVQTGADTGKRIGGHGAGTS